MSTTAGTIATAAYEGATELGQIQSYVGLIIGGLISIALIGCAIYLLTSNQNNLVDSTAIVQTASCVQQMIDKNVTQICNLKIKYTVSGKEYIENIVATGDKIYNVNDQIEITYNSDKPSEVTTKQIRNSTIGIVLSIVGILICGCVLLNYYMTSKSKLYAASQGTATVLGVVSSPFTN
jgi:hypothetical protein